MASTPSPFLHDDAKRLEEDRKHDEEIFLERKRLHEKAEKELHERTVRGKITDLERTLSRDSLELHAIQAETPELERRIRTAKRDGNSPTTDAENKEENAIRDSKRNIDLLKEAERTLERELEETKRKEHDAEDTLKAHERRLEQETREHEQTLREARDLEDHAHRRLEDKKREADKLETAIRRTESVIASLKREIH